MQYRHVLALSAAAMLAAATTIATATTSSADPAGASDSSASPPSGSFAYSGQEAREFSLPPGMQRVFTSTLPGGRTQTRYQQKVGRASVLGGQITVIARGGRPETVIGAYFPGLKPKNSVNIKRAEARSRVEARIGKRGTWRNELRIDPRNARLFYQVQSLRRVHRPVRWVDAGNGAIVKAFDAITSGEGIGVKGDRKTIDTTQGDSGDYQLISSDDRQMTLDYQNKRASLVVMTDPDDVWDLDRGIRSPSQPAGVDAHYYANLVDDFYATTFGRDSIDDAGMQIVSIVHFDNRYCNAFWTGQYMVYGDGDGKTCLPLSGGLDVDGHELTHGVTEFTSNLIYENESGALNEAFSDMMANTIEFYAEANGLDPAVEPDWFIGEDILLDGTANPGFRNMADPAEDGDPSHYSLRYTGTADNGGVHSNSGIANHAYYLAVEGGSNASCVANDAHDVLLTQDCDVVVPALGLARTADIFYTGFTSMTEYGNMCDARAATMAAAGDDSAAVGLAWDAVGVHTGCTPGTPPPPPCEGSANATLPIESPHPYGNNGDCTWTYTNPDGPGFRFVFTLMDMEKDYDYVYVKDGDGNVVATYTGTYRRPSLPSPCITTETASIQLTSDASVTAQGFTAASVEPC